MFLAVLYNRLFHLRWADQREKSFHSQNLSDVQNENPNSKKNDRKKHAKFFWRLAIWPMNHGMNRCMHVSVVLIENEMHNVHCTMRKSQPEILRFSILERENCRNNTGALGCELRRKELWKCKKADAS